MFAKFKDPRSRSHLFATRSKQASRSELFRGSVTRRPRPANSSTEAQSSSDGSQSVKDEADGDRDGLRRHEYADTNHRESPQEPAGLTSFDDSKTASVIEGFGDLKISGLVSEREKQERKKREREEELERQRIEEDVDGRKRNAPERKNC